MHPTCSPLRVVLTGCFVQYGLEASSGVEDSSGVVPVGGAARQEWSALKIIHVVPTKQAIDCINVIGASVC